MKIESQLNYKKMQSDSRPDDHAEIIDIRGQVITSPPHLQVHQDSNFHLSDSQSNKQLHIQKGGGVTQSGQPVKATSFSGSEQQIISNQQQLQLSDRHNRISNDPQYSSNTPYGGKQKYQFVTHSKKKSNLQNRIRPQSAVVPIAPNMRPVSGKRPMPQHQNLHSTLNDELYGGGPGIQMRAGSPGKSNTYTKMVPIKSNLSKEHLYATALDQKMVSNQLRDENTRLQTRVNYLEHKLSSFDPTGHVRMLQKQIKSQKERFFQLSQEFRAQQLNLKTTQVNECRAENELYKQELLRLRKLVDKSMNYQLAEVKFDNSCTPEGQEQRLRHAMKRNHEQSKVILQLQSKLSYLEKPDLDQLQKNSQLISDAANHKSVAEERADYINKLESTIKQLQQDHHQQLQAQHQEMNYLKQQAEKELETIYQENLDKVQSQIDLLSQEKLNLNTQWEHKFEQVKDEYQNMELACQKAQSFKDGQDKQISELEQALKWQQDRGEELATALNKLQYEQGQKEERASQLEKENSVLNMRVDQQDQMLQQVTESMNLELNQLKLQLVRSQSEEKSKTESTEQTYQIEISKLQDEFRKTQTIKNQQLEQQQTMYHQMSEQLQGKELQINSLKDTIMQLKQEFDKELSQTKSQDKQDQSFISQLKDQIKQLRMDVENMDQLKNQNSMLSNQISELTQQNLDLKQQIDSMNDARFQRRPTEKTEFSRRFTTEQNRERRDTFPKAGDRLTTGVNDETFDRDGTISQIPSEQRGDEMSYDDAPDDERIPFQDIPEQNSEHSSQKKGKFVEVQVEQVDPVKTQSMDNPELSQQPVSFADVQKPTNLQEARNAVLALNQDMIDDMSKMHNPNLGVAFVMDAVMTLLEKPTGWPQVKLALKEPNFLKQVSDYEPDRCTSEFLQKIQMYSKMPQFQYDKLKTNNQEAAVLCQWVKEVEAIAKTKQTVISDDQQKQSIHTAEFNVPNIKVNPSIASPQQLSSNPSRYHSDRGFVQPKDLKRELSQVSEKVVQSFENDNLRRNDVRESKESSVSQMMEEELTPEHEVIKKCLGRLKRSCQVNYIRFDHIENFIFGEGYRPEVRIMMSELAIKLQKILKVNDKEATLFAMYLVSQGQQSSNIAKISPQTKVLQCRVITLLQQNVNMYCSGVQVYSKKKEQKMRLIVGEAIQNMKIVYYSKWEHFESDLRKVMKVEKETIDCAFVYCLRMSQSLEEVNSENITEFIHGCKDDAFSHSRTGLAFPIQIEIVKESDDEQPIKEEDAIKEDLPSPSLGATQKDMLLNITKQQTDKALVSGSFDCNDRDDDDEPQITNEGGTFGRATPPPLQDVQVKSPADMPKLDVSPIPVQNDQLNTPDEVLQQDDEQVQQSENASSNQLFRQTTNFEWQMQAEKQDSDQYSDIEDDAKVDVLSHSEPQASITNAEKSQKSLSRHNSSQQVQQIRTTSKMDSSRQSLQQSSQKSLKVVQVQQPEGLKVKEQDSARQSVAQSAASSQQIFRQTTNFEWQMQQENQEEVYSDVQSSNNSKVSQPQASETEIDQPKQARVTDLTIVEDKAQNLQEQRATELKEEKSVIQEEQKQLIEESAHDTSIAQSAKSTPIVIKERESPVQQQQALQQDLQRESLAETERSPKMSQKLQSDEMQRVSLQSKERESMLIVKDDQEVGAGSPLRRSMSMTRDQLEDEKTKVEQEEVYKGTFQSIEQTEKPKQQRPFSAKVKPPVSGMNQKNARPSSAKQDTISKHQLSRVAPTTSIAEVSSVQSKDLDDADDQYEDFEDDSQDNVTSGPAKTTESQLQVRSQVSKSNVTSQQRPMGGVLNAFANMADAYYSEVTESIKEEPLREDSPGNPKQK